MELSGWSDFRGPKSRVWLSFAYVDVILGMEQLLHCHECGKGFTNAQVLKVHIRDVHENKGKVYNCEVCNKESKSLNGLRRHMSVYHRNHNSSTFINC